MNTNQLNKWILSVGLTLYFISGMIVGIQSIHPYRKIILLVGILFIFFSLSHSKKLILQFGTLRTIYYLFGVSILFAFVSNMETSIIGSGLGIILIGFAAMSWVPRSMAVNHYKIISLIKWLIFLHCLILLISVLTSRIQLSGYEGVFKNQGGIGTTSVNLCALILMLWSFLIFEKNVKLFTHIFLIVLLAATAFFSLISSSRGSVVAVLINIAVFAFFLLRNGMMVKTRIARNSLTLLVLLLCAFLILVYFTDFADIFQDNVIGKFATKSTAGDITNGRAEKWQDIFERAKLFGNGEYADMAAHNSFLSMLDQYGYIPFITWSLLTIVGVFKSFVNLFIKKKGVVYVNCPKLCRQNKKAH